MICICETCDSFQCLDSDIMMGMNPPAIQGLVEMGALGAVESIEKNAARDLGLADGMH